MLQPSGPSTASSKGRNTGSSHRGNKVAFGEFGLKATDRSRMTARQIEAARRAMTRHIKRGGQIWIRMFPDKPITQKPLEVRMGNGKGNVEYWVAKMTPGKVLYEIEGVDEATAREAFRLAAAKLPVATAFVQRRCADEQEEHQGTRAEPEDPARQGRKPELRDELLELRREQFNLRMAAASGQPARPDQHAKVRGQDRAREDRAREMDAKQAGARHERSRLNKAARRRRR